MKYFVLAFALLSSPVMAAESPPTCTLPDKAKFELSQATVQTLEVFLTRQEPTSLPEDSWNQYEKALAAAREEFNTQLKTQCKASK